jgi:hypothetical protein
VKENEIGRPYITQGEKKDACRVLAGKPEGRRQLSKPRRRWEDNIKIDLREIEWGSTE